MQHRIQRIHLAKNLIAITLLQFYLSASADVTVLPQVFNKSTWQNFSWKNIEESKIWLHESFREVSTDEAEGTTRRFAKGDLHNKPVTLMARKHTSIKYPKFSFVLSARDGDSCEWLTAVIKKQFGDPKIETDESSVFMGLKTQKNLKLWVIEKTAIVQDCYESPFLGKITFISFFEYNESFTPSPIIHLTCNAKMENERPGEYNDMDPTSINVSALPYSGIITNEEGEVVAMNARITDMLISYTVSDASLSIETEISRVTGKIRGKINRKEHPTKAFAWFSGECSKRDPLRKKF